MDFETYLQERFHAPQYGTAPGGLIAAHQEVIHEMEQLYSEGISLTSDKMLELVKRANEISSQIAEFNEHKT